MALTKVTGQVINSTTDLSVGVATVGGGTSTGDLYVVGVTTFASDVSIGGTLTYEDVTNVDSVGLITARKGISVTGVGVTIALGGLNVNAGIATFNDHVHLNDSKILKLGTDTDAQIVHTGAYGSLNVSTGYFVNDIAGDWYVRNTAGTENRIIAKNNGAVEIYHDSTKHLETTADGVTLQKGLTVIGVEGGDAQLRLTADEGDDNADKYRLVTKDAGSFYIENYTGSWESNIKVTTNAGVVLYYDNATRLTTTSTGVDVQTPGAATYLRVLGGEGGDAILRLHADEGDDGPDVWSIFAAQADGKLKIQNGASGSWEDSIHCLGDGGVDLFHNNVNTFSTMSSGAQVKTSGSTSYITMTTSGGDAGFLYANSNTDITIMDGQGHSLFKGTKDGASELFYDNSSNIQTTSTGAILTSGAAGTTDVRFGNTANRGLNIKVVNSAGNNDGGVILNAADTTTSGYHAYIAFQTGGEEKGRFEGQYDNFRLSNTCSGITFNGDWAAANRLNDYEEGTFTPAVTSGLAGGSISYNSRSGRYTKIGNVVHFTLHMNIASCSLDAGALKFGGLPKTSVDNGHICGGCYLTMSNGNMGSDKTYRVVADSTDIEVITAAGDAFAANSSTLNAGNRALSIHGSYYAAGN